MIGCLDLLAIFIDNTAGSAAFIEAFEEVLSDVYPALLQLCKLFLQLRYLGRDSGNLPRQRPLQVRQLLVVAFTVLAFGWLTDGQV